MTVDWVLLAITAWTLGSLALGMVIGRVIRNADEQGTTPLHEWDRP